MSDRPLLGVAGRWGDAEIALARSLDDLHQVIYRRGGIRPSNAAVEEIAKLVLVRLWSLRHPAVRLASGTPAGSLFEGAGPDDFALAFTAALSSPDLVAAHPSTGDEPLWPVAERFRITDPDVLAAAAAIVAGTVSHGFPAVSDPLGAAFDALLAGRYDHAGGLGTYLTPSGVARAMAEVAAELAQPPRSVHGPGFGDPYCGTGRFIVALLEVLRERDDVAARRLLRAGPFGADQSTSAVAKARINLLLYGVPRPLIWPVHDSVTDSDVDRLLGRVPLILTNPPFGEGKYDEPGGLTRTGEAMPRLAGRKRIDPSLASLVRSLRLLSPGGLLGIVLPDGVTSSAAFADLVLGSAGPLARDVSLVASISLPTVTFALSGTVAKTSAVFLRRERAGAAPVHVALARAEHVGYLRQAGRAAPDPAGSDLPAIARSVVTGLGRAEPSAASVAVESVAPLVAIVARDAVRSLDPSRLDPEAMAARQALAAAGGVELREYLDVVTAARPRSVTSPFVSVLHVDDVGTVDWHAANTHTPSTPGLLASPGDLIVSLLNPSRLRATVIPPGPPVQVSGEFGVFRASGDPYGVLGLLYSAPVRAQLRPLGTGTSSSRRRIDAEDVLSLVVPKLSAAALDDLGATVRDAQHSIGEGRARLWDAFDPR
jgi:hypothetical protein